MFGNGPKREAMEDLETRQAADRLLNQARRSTLVTLEAAMVKARPYRLACPCGDDALDAAQDLMTLSRLALRSAARLSSVVGALIGRDLRSWDPGPGGPTH